MYVEGGGVSRGTKVYRDIPLGRAILHHGHLSDHAQASCESSLRREMWVVYRRVMCGNERLEGGT